MKPEVWREDNTWCVSSATFNGFNVLWNFHCIFVPNLFWVSRGFEWVIFTYHIHNFWGSLLFLGKFICLLEDNSVGPFLFFRFVLGNSVSDGCLISSNSLQYSTIAKLFSPRVWMELNEDMFTLFLSAWFPLYIVKYRWIWYKFSSIDWISRGA